MRGINQRRKLVIIEFYHKSPAVIAGLFISTASITIFLLPLLFYAKSFLIDRVIC